MYGGNSLLDAQTQNLQQRTHFFEQNEMFNSRLDLISKHICSLFVMWWPLTIADFSLRLRWLKGALPATSPSSIQQQEYLLHELLCPFCIWRQHRTGIRDWILYTWLRMLWSGGWRSYSWVWEQAVGRFTLVVLLRSPDDFSLFGVVVCVFLFGWFCVGVLFVCFFCLCCGVVLLIHLQSGDPRS